MTNGTIVIGDWTNLDVQTMTNLYLYGQLDTPESYGERLRSNAEIESYPINLQGDKNLEIKIDMPSFMTSGPGRYAYASEASFVQDFFTGGTSLVNGIYTRNDLINNHGYSLADFTIVISHYETDPNSSDYALRTFVYNTASFVIADTAEFVVNGGNVYINKMSIHAMDDNFDFNSNSLPTQIGNLYLEDEIDPFSIGRRVEIEFTNKGAVPYQTTPYTSEHFLQDTIDAAAIPEGYLLTDAREAMLDVIDKLKEEEVIHYETANGQVKYGTNENDTISGTSGDDIIIAGGNSTSGGHDTVNAGDGNDIIYGHSKHISDENSPYILDGDTYNGGNGIDTIDYSNIELNVASQGYYSWGWGYNYGYGWNLENWNAAYPNGVQLGVNVDLTDDTQDKAYQFPYSSALYDTLSSIENVIGTDGQDVVYGNSSDNVFDGRDGVNYFDAWGGGSDTFIWNENQDMGSFHDVQNDDIIQLADFTADELTGVYFDDDYYHTGGYFIVWIDNGFMPSWGDLIFQSMQIYELDINEIDDHDHHFDFYSVGLSEAIRFRNPDGTYVGLTSVLMGSQELLEEESVFGGVGNDVISGTEDNDVIYTGDGNDTITSGIGDDSLYGAEGNDILNAGAGGDRVQAGKGDDIVSYVYSENVTSSDLYFGNQGEDHLDLYFTSAELSSSVKASIVSFRSFIGNSSNIDENATGGSTYDFSAFDLEVSRFETFTLFVNNVATQIAVDAKNDTFFGSVNTNITGNLLVNNGNGADTTFLDTVFANAGTFSTVSGGTIVINANGTFTYTPPNGFSGTDSFVYTANDGQGTTGTAIVEFGVGIPGVVAGTSANDTLNGTTGVDTIYGYAGNDTLNGLAGNDILIGGAGNDTMVGSTGDDIYYVDSSSDVITEVNGGGTDTVYSSTTFTLGVNYAEHLSLTGTGNFNATGNSYANTLTGNSGNNTLDGSTGADTLIGGAGNDTYIVDNASDVITENANEGTDTVQSYITITALAANVENVTLLGSSYIHVTGNSSDNTFIGNANGNQLYGLDGNDYLDAGAGNDLMAGGTGNDTYFVDGTAEILTENANEGTDTVNAYLTFVLATNFENLNLIGTAVINGTGNSVDNIITGNSAANTLSGMAGNDTMSGGAGNDTYVVDSTSDVVIENASEGTDLVQSSATFALGGNVENLTLTGIGNVNATGNALNNALTGNTGNNILDGGTGADTMIGGEGNDTYYVDSDLDVVTEVVNGVGIDLVNSAVSFSIATIYAEHITLTGTANVNATGNTYANTLIGNSGNNILDGSTGADTMTGGAGNDTYIIDNASDVVTENANEGIDTLQTVFTVAALNANLENVTLLGSSAIHVTGNGSDNILIGNSNGNQLYGLGGNDYLDAGAGNDLMVGGLGNDTYVFDSSGDLLTENANEGTDTVKSYFTFILATNFENLTLIGTSAINGTGTTANNIMIGNSAANTLDGLTGNDTMSGGAGNDIYIVDSTLDVVTEIASEGTDLVQASATFTLSGEVENLTLTGAGNINGTGNILSNTITGNTGNNILDGGAGNDTMIGGEGNDTYYVDSDLDVVTEVVNGVGIDLIYSTVSFSITTIYAEHITLTGNANVNATGNTYANTLIGNSGNNILDGSTGVDTMTGGLGNDTYVVDNISDVIIENANEGVDTLQTIFTVAALATNLENVTLLGTAAIHATGNSSDNTLIGNSNGNQLYGLNGNDYLDAGAGNDLMVGGLGDDTYVFDSSGDVLTENANEGTDTVRSNLTFTLATNFENLTLIGTTAINGTGNSVNNILIGNSAVNILDGSTGNDTMSGGSGNDTYLVDNASDVIVEIAGEGTDLVQSSAATYTLSANVENLTLMGTGAINGTGNDLNNTLTGNTGNNILDGGLGADTMIGGEGNDTYYVDSVLDVVTEVVNGVGIDLVYSTVSFSITTIYAEHITLTGTANVNATGNTYANTLTGNSGNNILDGSTGADTLIGGAGNDTYIVDNASDVITENANEGTDTVNSYITITALAANVENLTLLGSSYIHVTGNASDNILIGNANGNQLYGLDGNDYLDAGAGNDLMAGGNGNDTYFVDATAEILTENLNEGTDTVNSYVNYTLTANFENLNLLGTAALSGTGNTLDNTLTGNSAANTLTGSDGNDTLYGLDGNDTLSGGNNNDTIYGGAGLDAMTGGVGSDIFVFQAANAFSNIDTISDFSTAQTDKLNIADLLVGYTGASNINDFVTVTTVGSNTSFLVDRDGSGGSYSDQAIATLNSITGLTVDDLFNNGHLIV